MKGKINIGIFFFLGLFMVLFSAKPQSVPVNDVCDFAVAVELQLNQEKCIGASTEFASADGLTSACDPGPSGNNVWYKLVTIGDSTLISVQPVGYNPVNDLSVTVYEGSDCSSLMVWNCFSASGTNGISFNYRKRGNYLWIEIESNSTDGDFEICTHSVNQVVPGNICDEAYQICDKERIEIANTSSFSSSGTTVPCSSPDIVTQDTWFKFSVGKTGSLEFIITPGTATEFDWTLYRITSGCSSPVSVSCNYNYASLGACSNPGSPTGMLADKSGQPCAAEFNNPVNVTAGETYAIVIDNYVGNGSGFTFEWGSGTFELDVTADYSLSLSESCSVPVSVNLSDNSGEYAYISDYFYDFNDGTSDTASSLPTNHTFTKRGDFLTSVVVISSVSTCTSVMSKRINTATGPFTTLEPTDTAICGLDSFQVRNTISFGTPTLPQFYMNNSSVSIPNNSVAGADLIIPVSGISPANLYIGTITDVCFTIDHTRLEDITVVELVSPDGGVYDFDPLPLSGSGTVNYCFPDSILYLISGNTNGNWTLHVEDRVNKTMGITHTGTLDSFSFVINYENVVDSFSWSHPALLDDSNSYTPFVKPVTPFDLVFNVFDLNGCQNTDTVHIDTIVNPVAYFTKNDTVCYGDSALVEINLVGNQPFNFTYNDGSSNNVINYMSNTYSYYEKLTKTIEIASLSDAACIGYDLDTMEFKRLDSIKVDTVRLPCNGSQTKYVVDIDISGSDSNIYVVNGIGGSFIYGSPNRFVSDSIASGDNYSFSLTDEFSCNSILVEGNRNCLCDANGNLSGGDTICDGDSTELRVDLVGAGSYTVYYSIGAITYARSTAASPLLFTVKQEGYYRLDSISDVNCMTKMGKDSVYVKTTTAPTAVLTGGDSICGGDTATVTIALTGTPNWIVEIDTGSGSSFYNVSSSPIVYKVGKTITYSVNSLVDNVCPGYDLGTPQAVTVLEPDTAAFHYSSDQYCFNDGFQNIIPESGHNTGGTFSINPSTMSINAGGTFDPSSGSPGTTYYIKYVTANEPRCLDSLIDTVTINPLDKADFNYGDSIFCPLGTKAVNLEAGTETGGTFSVVPGSLTVDSSTGEIDLSTGVVPTVYTITYTTPKCINTHDEQVTFKYQDKASFSYDTTRFCQKDSVMPTLDSGSVTGGVFWTKESGIQIDSSTGTVNLDSSNFVYQLKVYYTTPAGICQHTDSITFRMLHQPTSLDWNIKLCEDALGSDTAIHSLVNPVLGYNYKDSINNPNYYYSEFYDSYDSLMAGNLMKKVNNLPFAETDTIYVISYDSSLTCYDTAKISFEILGKTRAGDDESVEYELDRINGVEINLNTLPTSGRNEFGIWLDSNNAIVEGDVILAEDYLEGAVFTYIDTGMAPCISDSSYLTVSFILPQELIIPNAFTPNDDGTNDLWEITGLNILYPNNHIIIYNRWGEKIYESSGYETPWDGTFKGKKVEANTYFYVLDLGDGSDKIRNTVTIIK